MLFSRNEFREKVFSRDNNMCVICKKPAQDAHHIIERRLFDDGGYYLDNGASLCGEHHIQAETTVLSCDEIRSAANIRHVILPSHLYPDERYDKWGNQILSNGLRMKGELFFDESVQKIIQPVLDSFQKYVKYPRTYHLPWSPGATKDDRILKEDSLFLDKNVVVTLKMDGENTTMYNDKVYARSIDGISDDTKHWIKNFHQKIAWEIPEGWRLCGENLHIKHSIKYDDLESYFLLFSMWDEKNRCLSWKDTLEYASVLGLKFVKPIYVGKYDRKLIEKSFEEYIKRHEGYVIRLADGFN